MIAVEKSCFYFLNIDFHGLPRFFCTIFPANHQNPAERTSQRPERNRR